MLLVIQVAAGIILALYIIAAIMDQ